METTIKEINTISPEDEYCNDTSPEHRKQFAQFFTPLYIVELMTEWLLGSNSLHNVVEPAFGLGIFSRRLLSKKKDLLIKGFELDEVIFNKAKNLFKDKKNVNLILQDYIFNDWKNKYDGIICNPPYFKFHDYNNVQTIKEIKKYLKCDLSQTSNLYTLFLLKSLYQLNTNGRCAYILPSEFLNSDYGKKIKSYLINTKMLRYVILFDCNESIFKDAITTASILLFANDTNNKHVQFINIKKFSDIENIKNIIKTYPEYKYQTTIIQQSKLSSDVKWKNYYQIPNTDKFKNIIPFSDYAKVVRGIATGANDYFTFNISKAKQFCIDEKFLLPCICKSTDIKNSYFTQYDFEKLKKDNKNIFLINAENNTDRNVTEYLRLGELNKINKKYLTSHRSPWYAIEKRLPAPIWVSVFNRKGLRFIRNEANILNLTTFHCIYTKFKDNNNLNINLFFAYLLTDTAKQIFEDNSREYGNGLKKFEPNDLNKSKIIDFSKLTSIEIREIVSQIALYKTDNQDSHIKKIDTIFKEKFFR